MHQGPMKSPTRPAAQSRDSSALVVTPGRRSNVSMDLPLIRSFRQLIKVTLIPFNSADISFSLTRNVESNFGGFGPAGSSEGHG